MFGSIYNADIYCEDCTEAIKQRIAKELLDGDDNSGMAEFLEGENPITITEIVHILHDLSQHYYDSDQYPKDCNVSSEADYPQYCGDCGLFLENDLTTDGEEFVQNTVNEALESGDLDYSEWKLFYDYLDYDEKCEQCGHYANLDCGICIDCEEGRGFCNCCNEWEKLENGHCCDCTKILDSLEQE